jgi:hypothetical protein
LYSRAKGIWIQEIGIPERGMDFGHREKSPRYESDDAFQVVGIISGMPYPGELEAAVLGRIDLQCRRDDTQSDQTESGPDMPFARRSIFENVSSIGEKLQKKRKTNDDGKDKRVCAGMGQKKQDRTERQKSYITSPEQDAEDAQQQNTDRVISTNDGIFIERKIPERKKEFL